MQKLRQDDPLSHFGVGGIHGLPYERWEGSGNATGEPDSFGGYCSHGDVLFPTWHRPYVALHEVRNTSRGLTHTTMVLIELQQLLQQHALVIAKKYQDQSRWLRAAQDLRAPYWDWAANSIPPPEVISLKYLDIVKPEGKKTVENPLFQYKFDPVHPSFKKYYDDAPGPPEKRKPPPFHEWKTTIRHPDNFGKDAKTDVQKLIECDFTFPDPSLSHLVFPVS
jgi:tyrosinase